MALINSPNNRLAWGGMMAINYITMEIPDSIYKLLPRLIDAADKGSVITRDNLVRILIKLTAQKKYADKAFSLLMEQLVSCPTNQLPMYAENAMPVIPENNKPAFSKALQQRLQEVESEPKKNRLRKVIKRMSS